MKKKIGLIAGVVTLFSVLICGTAITELGGSGRASAIADEDLTFSKDSGYYKSSFNLEITAEAGSTIYYTTDCSVPTVENGVPKGNTKKYTGPISIKNLKGTEAVLANDKYSQYYTDGGWAYNPDKSKLDRATIIRAIGISADGETTTPVSTRTFFIDNDIKTKYNKCAVMSIVTDPANLVDGKTGIYVLGDEYLNSSMSDDDFKNLANFMQHGKDYERSSYMDFFNGGDTPDLSQGVGIRIHGGYSRRNQQKSLNIYFRKDYDYGTKNLKGYDLIPGNTKVFYDEDEDEDDGKVLKYSNVMIRNGGNDVDYSKFQDAFIQSMVTDKNFGTQSSRPCMLYLNGEFWGLYNLTEKYSDNSISTEYGVDKDNVIVYKDLEIDEGEALDPDGKALEELLALGDLDMTKEENYKKFQDMVDIDSYVDYVATEIYINNNDWWSGCNAQTPHNNIEFWKVADPTKEDPENPYGDGKWRYLLFDTEWSMGIYGSREAGAEYDSIKYHAIGEPDSSNSTDNGRTEKNGDPVFAALIKNADFRQRLTTAILDIRNWNFEYQRSVNKLNEFKSLYEPLMKEHQTRWNTGNINTTMNNVTSFLKKRSDYVLTMLENDISEVKKADRSEVTVYANVYGKDYVSVNTILPDISAWWKGTYYKAYPLHVEAKDIEGYTFDSWEVKGGTISDDDKTEKSADIKLTDSKTSVRAVYKFENGDPVPSPSASPVPTATPTPEPTRRPWDPWDWGDDPWNPRATATPKPSKTPAPSQPSPTASVAPSTDPQVTQNSGTAATAAPAGKVQTPAGTTQAGQTQSGTVTTETSSFKKGDKYTVGKGVYSITSDETVTYVKPTGKKLKTVNVPATVTIKGKKLKVTAIAPNAFKNNKKLTKAVIGSNVKTIGKLAFKGCKKLRTIQVKSSVLESVGSNVLSGISAKAVIKVPASKKSSYKELFDKKGQKNSVKVK